MRTRVLAAVSALACVLGLAMAPPAYAEPPTNDNFANAETVSVPSSDNPVSFVDATREADEPYCDWYGGDSVWFVMTAPSSGTYRITTATGWPVGVGVYTANSTPDIATLTQVACQPGGDPVLPSLAGGTTYYVQVSAPWSWLGPSSTTMTIEQLLPPANDDFADAQQISLGQTVDVETTAATQEDGEDFCAGTTGNSVWFSFRPATSGTIAVQLPKGGFADVYTGAGFPLDPVSCAVPGFVATGGTSYWIQVVNAPPGSPFTVEAAPAPSPSPWMYNVTGMAGIPVEIYANNTEDPVRLFPTTVSWDFGDGTPGATDPYRVQHTYAKDGDYTVTLTSTTSDGRSGSGILVIPIRTHDVSVVSFTAPTNARAGQSKTFAAGIRNTHYVETAQVVLLRGGPGGWTVVTTSNVTLPVRAANKTTSVNLPYVFTTADAKAGTVSFKVQVSINVAELQTTDNEMVCPPVRVTK